MIARALLMFSEWILNVLPAEAGGSCYRTPIDLVNPSVNSAYYPYNCMFMVAAYLYEINIWVWLASAWITVFTMGKEIFPGSFKIYKAVQLTLIFALITCTFVVPPVYYLAKNHPFVLAVLVLLVLLAAAILARKLPTLYQNAQKKRDK